MNIRSLPTMLGAVVMMVALAGTVRAAELKIGFVDPARISAQAPQAEAVRQRLEQEFAPRRKKIVAMQKDLRALKERLQRNEAVMSEERRLQLQQEIDARRREIRHTQGAYLEDLKMRGNEKLAKLQRRVLQTVRGFAKEQDYDLIVTDGVIYASEEVDITDQIIERLRADYQSGRD